VELSLSTLYKKENSLRQKFLNALNALPTVGNVQDCITVEEVQVTQVFASVSNSPSLSAQIAQPIVQPLSPSPFNSPWSSQLMTIPNQEEPNGHSQ